MPEETRIRGLLDDHLFVRLLGARRLTIDASWKSRDVRSTFWRLYYNGEAGAALRLDDEAYEITPRVVHLIPAWVAFSCLCRQPTDHLYVHFDVIGITGPSTRRLFPTPVPLAAPRLVHAATEIAENRALTSGTGVYPSATARIKALVYLALAELLTGLSDNAVQVLRGRGGEEPCVVATLQWIEDHLAESIHNDELAARCCFSTDHFVRRFKATVGQTPARHIAERRVAVAAERLLFTDQSIESIAESVGFPNRHYFSRVFAQKMGLPPASYRRTAHI